MAWQTSLLQWWRHEQTTVAAFARHGWNNRHFAASGTFFLIGLRDDPQVSLMFKTGDQGKDQRGDQERQYTAVQLGCQADDDEYAEKNCPTNGFRFRHKWLDLLVGP